MSEPARLPPPSNTELVVSLQVALCTVVERFSQTETVGHAPDRGSVLHVICRWLEDFAKRELPLHFMEPVRTLDVVVVPIRNSQRVRAFALARDLQDNLVSVTQDLNFRF